MGSLIYNKLDKLLNNKERATAIAMTLHITSYQSVKQSDVKYANKNKNPIPIINPASIVIFLLC